MTEFNTGGSDDNVDALKGLEYAVTDPAWKDLFDAAKEINASYGEYTDDQLELLNFAFTEQGLADSEISLSGKVRRVIYDESSREGIDISSDHIEQDSQGFYEQVIAYECLTKQFVRRDQVSDSYQGDEIVLALFDKMDDETDGSDKVELYVRLDDIENVQFEEMSIKGIEEYLKCFYPDIYNRIDRFLPANNYSRSYKSAVESLKKIELPNMDQETLLMTERIVFQRLNLENNLRVNVDGKVNSTDEDGEYVEDDMKGSFPLAHPQLVLMLSEKSEENQHVRRPALVFAVPAEEDGDYYRYVVPGRSIESVRSVKWMYGSLGGRSLMTYDGSMLEESFEVTEGPISDTSDVLNNSEPRSGIAENSDKSDKEIDDIFKDIIRGYELD